MSQLHIRPPEQENPDLVFLECIVVTILVCGVGIFGALQQSVLADHDPVAARAAAKLAAEPPELRRAVELRQRTDLDARRWDQLDLVSALRHGPYDLAMTACERWLATRPGAEGSDASLDDAADRAVAAELLSVISRRVSHLPLACVLRAHLGGQLAAHAALDAEAAKLWAEVASFEHDPAAAERALRRWQQTRKRPESPAFYEFVSLCAMRRLGADSVACRDMLRQLAPKHGGDMLDVIDRYTTSHAAELTTASMQYPLEGLSTLARSGQPPNLRAAGDVDLKVRKGAVLALCRIVHHPDHKLAAAAGNSLGFVANIDARGNDRHTRARWLDTCRLLFGGTRPPHVPGEAPSPTTPVAALELDPARPDPSLHALRAAGHCAPTEPLWGCAWEAPPWLLKGEDLSFELRKVYVETRHIEWGEAWFDAVEVWELEKKQRAEEAAKQPTKPPAPAPTKRPSEAPKKPPAPAPN